MSPGGLLSEFRLPFVFCSNSRPWLHQLATRSGFARLDRIFGGELGQVLDTFNDSLWPPAA